MESLPVYIIQVNILLGIICLGYFALLKNLTFCQLNRFYFLSGGLFALVYPFLDVRSLFRGRLEPMGEWTAYLPDLARATVAENVGWTVAGLVYGLMALVGTLLLGRLAVQLLSLLRIHLHSVAASWKRYVFRNVLLPIVPFSFFNRIYVNKNQHQESELHDIFAHEDIHARGLHTLDVLAFELLLAACWYNPFVWLMRRAVRQNLEFLTDQQVLNKGIDRQTYQYSLLHVGKRGVAVPVSNQFNFKLLKKRIMMMNKKRSSKLELGKYAFLLPVMIFAAAAFTVDRADAGISEVVSLAETTKLETIREAFRKPDTAFHSPEHEFGMAWTHGTTSSPAGEADTTAGKASDTTNTSHRSEHDATMRISGYAVPAKDSMLLVIDGEERPMEDLEKQDPAEIEAVDIIHKLLSENARAAGENAIISITTVKSGGPTVSVVSKKAMEAAKRAKATTGKAVVSTEKTKTITGGKSRPGKVYFSARSGEPLIVLDGVVQTRSSLEVMDPNEIEAISILKDGAATSVYGEKGKNGVLRVTTKGKATKTITATDPLQLIIDGEEHPMEALNSLPPGDIESMEALKNEDIPEKDRMPGRNGIIKITTKK